MFQAEILRQDGSKIVRAMTETPTAHGVRLTLAQTEVPADYAEIRLLPGYFDAQAGDDGYYVVPFCNGTFISRFHDRADTQFSWNSSYLSFTGAVRGDHADLLIFEGMRLGLDPEVTVIDGHYTLNTRILHENTELYEDISVELIQLTGADATYAGMARAYRAHELAAGNCRPLAEKAEERPILKRLVHSPEIRIRLAWKPAPPEILEQTVENEPEMHIACTFAQAEELVAELKRQGIADAELCLVGWNVSGHDGRYPQMFPVEPKLGGESALRHLIAAAQDAGYQIVCHTNSTDAYTIAEDWDPEWIIRKADGSMAINDTGWSGGRMYWLCPHAAEKLADRDLPRVRDLGFAGSHYIDVITTVAPRQCLSKQHYALKNECADAWRRIMKKSADLFGAISSEGTWGYAADVLDFGLYSAFNLMGQQPDIVDETVPLYPLVYHGITLYNPSAETVNFPVKSAKHRLKFFEFGGRPAIYYYAKFVNGNSWMGTDDFLMDTPEQLTDTVGRIRKMMEDYRAVEDLQYVYMENHERIADGVYRVTYANGARMIVNYTDAPVTVEGTTVPAVDFAVIS